MKNKHGLKLYIVPTGMYDFIVLATSKTVALNLALADPEAGSVDEAVHNTSVKINSVRKPSIAANLVSEVKDYDLTIKMREVLAKELSNVVDIELSYAKIAELLEDTPESVLVGVVHN